MKQYLDFQLGEITIKDTVKIDGIKIHGECEFNKEEMETQAKCIDQIFCALNQRFGWFFAAAKQIIGAKAETISVEERIAQEKMKDDREFFKNPKGFFDQSKIDAPVCGCRHHRH